MHHMTSSELPESKDQAAPHATFEETYQRHEFAELVRLALAAGRWLASRRRPVQRPGGDVYRAPLPGEIKPAE